MDSKRFKIDVKKFKDVLKTITIDKWLLMGAAGVVLVLCSESCQGSAATDNAENQEKDNNIVQSEHGDDITAIYNNQDDYAELLESRLEEMLSSLNGVGNVKVMITLKNTATKEVLKEEPYTENIVREVDGAGGSRDTSEKSQDYRVIYESDAEGNSIPFIISEESPKVEGVAVIADGGDSPVIKEKITNIIKALFDIEINKIAVGK